MTPEIVRAIAQAEVSRLLSFYEPPGDEQYTLATVDDTPTELIRYELTDNTGGLCQVKIGAVYATGSAAMSFILAASYLKLAGDVTVNTATSMHSDAGGLVVTLSGSSGDLVVEVEGIAGFDINWTAELKLIEAPITDLS
jgi:hypothetical protein